MSRRWLRAALAALLVLAVSPGRAAAHVGSPDVFVETKAGPYTLLVTVRPPVVIPGVADIEILATGPDIREIRIVPMPLTGVAAKFAPTPDRAVRSPDDPRLFTGHLWMMQAGAWQVRVSVDGAAGAGETSVPVPTLPQTTSEMTGGLAVLLFAIMAVLAAGLVSIVAAMAREASLGAGEQATPRARRRGWIAAGVATLVVTGILSFGNWWWSLEASAYARYVYKPLLADATIAESRLSLAVRDPGWISLRRVDDFVADHGHLMHLFVVSPALDRLWHLHPESSSPSTFEQFLPEMAKGPYEFFGDLVHASGIAETVTGRLEIAGDAAGTPLAGDDSAWSGGPQPEPIAAATESSPLPDGGRMIWVRDGGRPLRPRQLNVFTFRVEDASGKPAGDMELYMGMPGHAVFVRRDRGVFAHVHPSGSAPMAAMEMAAPAAAAHMHEATLPPTVSFPYGLPSAGDYRIFVQVKRSGRIDTGVFDVRVE